LGFSYRDTANQNIDVKLAKPQQGLFQIVCVATVLGEYQGAPFAVILPNRVACEQIG
jgi:hypothetical protein